MFAKLGKVISSAGSERFASDMHALLVESIPLAITRMTEWTLNEPAGEVVRVQSLGAFGAPGGDGRGAPAAHGEREPAAHPPLNRILAACDRQLIHINPLLRRGNGGDVAPPRGPGGGFQCHLVSGKANRRYVISLHRTASHRDFSLQEMSFLKFRRYAVAARRVACVDASARHARMRDGARCDGRLTRRRRAAPRVRVAARARGSCCRRVKTKCASACSRARCCAKWPAARVKESTIETYIKRAAVKLGISGRHGSRNG